MQADKDGDGEITLEEFIPIVEQLFYRKSACVRGRLQKRPEPTAGTQGAVRGWGVRL